jgi:hypothetical protein
MAHAALCDTEWFQIAGVLNAYAIEIMVLFRLPILTSHFPRGQQ